MAIDPSMVVTCANQVIIIVIIGHFQYIWGIIQPINICGVLAYSNVIW